MVEYSLAHIGINCEDEAEALRNASLIEAMFGFPVKNGNSSVFTGSVVELNKKPGRGKHGHIAIGTPDLTEAMKDLESRGFSFDPNSAKYKPDGTLNAIYLTQEICGFAVHLVKKA